MDNKQPKSSSSSTLDMELEEWELLPRDVDPSKSSATKGNSKGIVNVVDCCFDDPSRILLESIEDVSKIIKDDQDEKIIVEVTENNKTELPTSTQRKTTNSSLFLNDNKTEDGGFGVAKDEELRWDYEEKEEEEEEGKKNAKTVKEEEECCLCNSDQGNGKKTKGGLWEGINGFSVMGWRFSGIGALCTIGVAAATICIFILGSRSRHKHHNHHKIQYFQIYSHDKNLKQMVEQATRLNNAISAGTRGVPMAPRANITFGGHYAGA